MVPDYYTRKQTLTNAERYITPRLKELEDMILGAEDKLYALEYEAFVSRSEQKLPQKWNVFNKQLVLLPNWMHYASLALVASRNQFVRPKINDQRCH